MAATATAREIIAHTCAEITLRVAATREERESAFRLTYDSYLRAGLCSANSSQLRITPYQLLSTTDLFVAQLRNKTICTLSLVRDGELGLPMEDVFSRQIAERRAAGLRLAEVSCLADRRSGTRRFFGLFCDMIRLMVQLAEQDKIDQLLIAVHPRHAHIYQRCMGFKKIGDTVDYSTVQGNPAVPLCLDLSEVRLNSPKIWNRFFEERIPRDVLKPQPISYGDREYFTSLLDVDELLPSSKSGYQGQNGEEEAYEECEALLEEPVCA